MKRDVPYEYRGGQKFFERAHIKDVVAFLRVEQNPKDEIAWLRVLGLQQGIGAATATQLANQFLQAPSLSNILETDVSSLLPARAKNGWRDFSAIASSMLGRTPSPDAMIRAILDSEYRSYLEREYPNWRERLEDLEQLALFAEGYEQAKDFLADIALYDDVVSKRESAIHNSQSDNERIVLSTIHQAKGLEWDTVFIIHLADGFFPNRRALAEEGGMEEERRLFYVATTRARRLLFLTYPLTVGYDTLMFNQPSTFLDEVSPRLFERVELREAAVGATRRVAHTSDEDQWSWDEPVIQVEAPKVAWKKNVTPPPAPPQRGGGKKRQLLSDIDEL
jgi:DNA helicase-2/ATP-dependent DNA helicase PcrA